MQMKNIEKDEKLFNHLTRQQRINIQTMRQHHSHTKPQHKHSAPSVIIEYQRPYERMAHNAKYLVKYDRLANTNKHLDRPQYLQCRFTPPFGMDSKLQRAAIMLWNGHPVRSSPSKTRRFLGKVDGGVFERRKWTGLAERRCCNRASTQSKCCATVRRLSLRPVFAYRS